MIKPALHEDALRAILALIQAQGSLTYAELAQQMPELSGPMMQSLTRYGYLTRDADGRHHATPIGLSRFSLVPALANRVPHRLYTPTGPYNWASLQPEPARAGAGDFLAIKSHGYST